MSPFYPPLLHSYPCRRSPGASAVTSTWLWLISSGEPCFTGARSEWKSFKFHFCHLQRCKCSSEDGPRQVGAPEPRLKPVKVKQAPTLQHCSPGINLQNFSPPLGCLKHCKDRGETLNSPSLSTGLEAGRLPPGAGDTFVLCSPATERPLRISKRRWPSCEATNSSTTRSWGCATGSLPAR